MNRMLRYKIRNVGTWLLLPVLFTFLFVLTPASIRAQEKSGQNKQSKDVVRETPDEKLYKLVNTGKYERAKKSLNKTLKKGSLLQEGNFRLLMRLYRETGAYEKGKSKCQTYLEKRKDVDVRVDLAHFLYRLGDYENALTHINNILDTRKDHLHARWLRMKLHQTVGKYDKLKEDFKYVLNVAKDRMNEMNSAEDLYHLSRGLWTYANWEGDVDMMKKVVGNFLFAANDKDPDLLPMKTFWADCYAEKEGNQSAVQTYGEVLQKNNNYAPALTGMATVAAGSKRIRRRTGKPKDLARRALKSNPNYVPAILLVARRHLIKDNYGKASEQIQKALEVNKHSSDAWGLKAALHYMKHEKKQYRQARKKALAINSRFGQMDALIGHILTQDMQFHEAQEFYDKATELNPNLWSVQSARGMNYLRLGMEKKGKNVLEKAHENNPFNIKVVNTLDLLDLFETEFTTYKQPKGYLLRVHNWEAGYATPWVQMLLERIKKEMDSRYNFKLDKPMVVEFFNDHRDFSVRTTGMEGIGAKGACFGKVCTVLSPRAKDQIGPYNWGSTMWHEMGHAYALQLSEWNVPRWFTESLSVYEETLGPIGWEREIAVKVYQALETNKLPTLMEIDSGKKRTHFAMYQYGRKIQEFIAKEYGFDAIVEILKEYSKEKNTNEAFKAALGDDLKTVEKKLHKWIRDWIDGYHLRNIVTQKELKGYQKRLDKNKKDAEAHALIALRYAQRKKSNKAKSKAEEAIEINPEIPMPYIVLGDVQYNKKNWSNATHYYEKAFDRGANDFQTSIRHARALERTDQPNKAITYYEKARKLFPRYVKGNDNPYLRLFELYRDTNQGLKALNRLKGYCARAHKDFGHNRQLAEFLVKLERWEEAKEVLERILWINYRDLKLLSMLGKTYQHLEEWKHAHTAYISTINLLKEINKEGKTDKLVARYFLKAAKASLKLDRKNRAREEAEKAQERDPGNTSVDEFLQKLDS